MPLFITKFGVDCPKVVTKEIAYGKIEDDIYQPFALSADYLE